MEGTATTYMRMPMSTSTLPIQGKCTVAGKLVCLRFSFTGIEFEVPNLPTATDKCTFRIRGAKGDLIVSITYLPELLCYTGVGKEEDDAIVIRFMFWGRESPMTKLPQV